MHLGSSRKLGSTCPNPPEIRHIFIKFGNFFSDSEKEIVPYVQYFLEKFKKWKKKYCTYGKLYLFSEKIEVRKNGFFKKWSARKYRTQQCAVFVCSVIFRPQNTEHRSLKFWEYGTFMHAWNSHGFEQCFRFQEH